jgi:hypothetical protein
MLQVVGELQEKKETNSLSLDAIWRSSCDKRAGGIIANVGIS